MFSYDQRARQEPGGHIILPRNGFNSRVVHGITDEKSIYWGQFVRHGKSWVRFPHSPQLNEGATVGQLVSWVQFPPGPIRFDTVPGNHQRCIPYTTMAVTVADEMPCAHDATVDRVRQCLMDESRVSMGQRMFMWVDAKGAFTLLPSPSLSAPLLCNALNSEGCRQITNTARARRWILASLAQRGESFVSLVANNFTSTARMLIRALVNNTMGNLRVGVNLYSLHNKSARYPDIEGISSTTLRSLLCSPNKPAIREVHIHARKMAADKFEVMIILTCVVAVYPPHTPAFSGKNDAFMEFAVYLETSC